MRLTVHLLGCVWSNGALPRYTTEEIARALELDLTRSTLKTLGAQPHDEVFIPAPARNPVITALQARGLYRRDLGQGKHEIICLWAHEHTGSATRGTAYFEPHERYPLGGFKCLHSHGDKLKIHNLLDFLGVDVATARMRPSIRVVKGELDRVVEAAEARLAELGQHWQCGGVIVTVGRDEFGDARIIPTSLSALTRDLSCAATWERYDERARGWRRCDPPERQVRVLHAAQHYRHLPELRGIARQPYFHDGRLVMTLGYDAETAFDPTKFPVDLCADRARAAQSLRALTELLAEFRFAAEHDRAAALSAIITAAVRPSLPHAPMFHVRAPVMGCGKSYLCKLITAFATPGKAAPSSYPSDSAEATKSLLALLLQNPAVVEFDDMANDLVPFSAMNRALTEEYVSDRILGESRVVRVSTRVLFLSSGNNVYPVRDMTRRVITIAINPLCQSPAQIAYRGAPLDKVHAERERYVARALDLVLAWRNAGCPKANVSSIATYNGEWADYARHPLIWLGWPDPATSLLEQINHDPDADLLGRILALWRERFGNRALMVRDVLQQRTPEDELFDCLYEVAGDRNHINPSRLGCWIRRKEDRIVNGLAFRRGDGARNAVTWRVVAVAHQQ